MGSAAFRRAASLARRLRESVAPRAAGAGAGGGGGGAAPLRGRLGLEPSQRGAEPIQRENGVRDST